MLNDAAVKAASEVAVTYLGGAPEQWVALVEGIFDEAEPILLADAQREIEHLRGIIERVAWRTARMVGAVSTEEIEPLPEDYDLEDLHARLQTQIGIERLESAHEIERLTVMLGGHDPYAIAAQRDAFRDRVAELTQELVDGRRAADRNREALAQLLRTRCRCAELGTDNPAQCEYEDAAQIAEAMFAQPDPEETP